jgi:hypothetical protein
MTTVNVTRSFRSRAEALGRRLSSRDWGPGFLAGIVLLILYLVTLQRIISGSGDEYMYDAGEMQVALNLWGTPHAPSYPLFIALSAPLVALFKLFGTNPAAAASTASLVWGLAALGVTYDLLRRRTGQPWLAGLLVLVLGLMQSMWLHNVIAEVYSLYLLFVALILWLALADENADWSRRRWLALAALLGFGVAHHRAVAFLVPGLMVYLWPEFWRARREMPLTLLLGMLLFLAGFLPYLYIPLYARLGGIWYYGDPSAPDGLWTIISAKDWDYAWDPPHDLADLGAHVAYIVSVLVRQFTWPGLAVGVAGSVSPFFATGHSKRAALLLALSIGTYIGFMLWFPELVVDDPEPTGALPLLLLAVVALGEALRIWIVQQKTLLWVSGGLLAVFAGFLIWRNLPFIYDSTHDPAGVIYREQVATLTPVEADTYFFATPWGPHYMAMAYGLLVTQEYGGFEPVDHNADFEAILARGDRLVTTPDMLYAYPREWWVEGVGGEMYLRSAGPGFVEIDNAPLADANVPEGAPAALENGVWLLASEVEALGDGRYALTLYWQAVDPPDENYSVFVHLADSDSGEVLVQADSYAPVSGWYPVTDWRPGEVVRDEYRVAAPEGYTGSLVVRAGMYRQLEDGSFENLDALSQHLR